ncbi:helix-turn-helix transcriptional regulator [Rhizobium leguminosarum]|uniref:helix-turn-helix transcriptional regulator n=1 Tax=Rhizobium leguminosarum TaxID=384 RepID=UPI001F355907|nr:LuxR family transcriptional regulator [Rhizobium leguminosarum]UIJ82287.1 LuxR family transcriptional regulator [Rhizobium leguminosarum]
MTTEADAELALGTFFHHMQGLISIEQMFERLTVFGEILGYPLIAYRDSTHVKNPHRGKLQPRSNYPAAWQEHCSKKGYDQLSPVVTATRSQWFPLFWGEVYSDPSTSDRDRRIFDEAKNFGLQAGFTLSLRGRAGISATMSFVQTEAGETKDLEIRYLQLAAWLFHWKVTNILDCTDDCPRLTQREIECLCWAAKGKSSFDISCIVGISKHTVDFHIKNAMRKLKVGNRIVAVQKAARLGLIELEPQ